MEICVYLKKRSIYVYYIIFRDSEFGTEFGICTWSWFF